MGLGAGKENSSKIFLSDLSDRVGERESEREREGEGKRAERKGEVDGGGGGGQDVNSKNELVIVITQNTSRSLKRRKINLLLNMIGEHAIRNEMKRKL